jgi:hypothetical protein
MANVNNHCFSFDRINRQINQKYPNVKISCKDAAIITACIAVIIINSLWIAGYYELFFTVSPLFDASFCIVGATLAMTIALTHILSPSFRKFANTNHVTNKTL